VRRRCSSCASGGGDRLRCGSCGNGGGDVTRCGFSVAAASTCGGCSVSATAEFSLSSSSLFSLSLSTFSTASKSGRRGDGGTGTDSNLPDSSTRAPQKARCVTKLSLLIHASMSLNESNKRIIKLYFPSKGPGFGSIWEGNLKGGEKQHLVKRVPQSQRYSRVPQVLACALRSAWTA
jgi:hypothetical protein